MSLLSPVSTMDLVFLTSVGLLTVAVAALRRERRAIARGTAAAGWAVFAVFWLSTAAGYLGDARYFLGLVSLVTGGVSAYGVRLSVDRRPPYASLTTAFALMGLLFVPYQFVDPVFHAVVRTVTAQTAGVLALVGFEPQIVAGSAGERTAIVFESHPFVVYNIVSACTGFGAIALFAGLVAVGGGTLRRRLAGAIGVGILVYLLNIFRTVMVGGSIPSEMFAVTAPLITPLFGVSRPALVSFYFAEYVFAQTLIVVVLLGVYLRLTRLFPALQRRIETLLQAIHEDTAWLVSHRPGA